MKLQHICILIFGTAIWGLNFVFIKHGLNDFPPFLFCTLRFLLTAFPMVFILPKPDVPWKILSLYSGMTFLMQFGLMFSGIKLGMSPGMTSVVMQIYIFVSILVATIVYKEDLKKEQVIGAVVSFAGIGLIGYHAIDFNMDVPFAGFILVVLAAIFTGTGNLLVKSMGKANMFSIVVWSNLVIILPMFGLSLIFEGTTLIIDSLKNASLNGVLSLGYVVFISTFIGFFIWNKQMQRYPAAMVMPFGMLIPIFGMGFSALFTGETLEGWKILAAGFVIGGLAINLFGGKIRRRFIPKISS